MKTIDIARIVRTTRTNAAGLILAASLSLTGALGIPLAAAAPSLDGTETTVTRDQNVDYLSTEQAIYLGSSGVDVLVPSWLPGPVSGVPVEARVGDGFYSLYWFGGGGTHMMVTAVAGGGFPGGSEANLNVELFVNTSVQGWPAIHDIGIPEGSDVPIYDKVMWIAGGVLYTVTGNNLGTDSVSIANSMIYLEAPAPVPTEVSHVPPTEVPYVPPTEVPYVPPTEVPYVPPTEVPYVPATDVPYTPPTEAPYTPATEETTVSGTAESGVQISEEPATLPEDTSTESVEGPANVDTDTTAQDTLPQDVTPRGTPSAPPVGDGTGGGAWSPSMLDQEIPSDGTAGPRPPVVGSDGTGGQFDTTVPAVRSARP